MRCSKRQAVFTVSISQLNKTSYQKKVPVKAFKIWFGSKETIIGFFWHFNSLFGHLTMSIWAHISRTDRGKPYIHLLFYKKNYFIKVIWRNLKNKIVDLTVKLYYKGDNLNFQISPNYLDKIILVYKTKGVSTVFLYLCVKYELIWT